MLLLLVLLAAQGASAPGAQPVPERPLSIFADARLVEALGGLDPQAGAWAEYAVVPRRGARLRVRAAVLSVLPDGRYWLEIASQRSDGPPVAMKLLVHGQPSRASDLERAFLYVGGQAPIELPAGEALNPAERKEAAPLPRLHQEPAREVRVPAGTFRADVARVAGARIYRAKTVPLWGLVEVESRARRVELLGFGRSGAASVFPAGWSDPVQGNGKDSVK